MYAQFQDNLMAAILSYKIINIYLKNGKKIVIGDGGVSKSSIRIKPFGFVIKDFGSAKWYSFASIQSIEVFGYEL
jgi:hypothetical protein